MTSAEISIIPEFQVTLNRLGIAADFQITKRVIRNKRTGSFIYFSGIKTSSGDQTAKLKSMPGITTWVIEEGEDFKDEKTFDTIDDSIRVAGIQNRVIWIQNPTTPQHFIYSRFIEPKSKKIQVEGLSVTVSDMPEVEHIHTTYHIAEDLGYLQKSWVDKAKKAYQDVKDKIEKTKKIWTKSAEELQNEIRNIWHTSYYYYNYIGGWLEQAEGVIFTNWIEGEFDESLPYCYGLDYGFTDPLAMTKVAYDKRAKRLYVKEIVYESGLEDIAERLRLLEISKRDLIVADTNEPRTTRNIARKGFNIQKVIKNLIKDDIREIKQLTIVVAPESKKHKN